MRTRLALLVAAACALALAAASPAAGPRAAQDEAANPCTGPEAYELLCPDLRMRPPFDLHRQRRGNRTILRAANSIDSRGRGPAELRGTRTGPNTMDAVQAIHRTDGGVELVDTGARLGFKSIPGQYRYWKFTDAARFELWTIDSRNRRVKLVRTGPKVYYCLRDLVRTRAMPGSPRRFVYPRCSQNRRARGVTLGTSVGWSDVYPWRYHEQWIDITGLRGRFAFVHIADPRDGIRESDETNNEGETLIRLPSARVIGREQPTGPTAPPAYR